MNHSATDLVYMALGAVLIALCSWITVPAAVPFTMQTFAVFFILSALGGKQGTVTILVYIALGAVGVRYSPSLAPVRAYSLAIPAATSLAFLPWDLPIGGSPSFLEIQERSGSWASSWGWRFFMPLAPPGSFSSTPELREVSGSSRFLAGVSFPL